MDCWALVDLRGHACEPHSLSKWLRVLLLLHWALCNLHWDLTVSQEEETFFWKNGNLFTLTATSER